MFIPALKQTIFPIRSKLLVYNRQHLFSKSHIYRSPSLRFTEASTSNPLGKRWRSLSRFPWKTVSSGTSNAVAASARYHATSPSSLIKSRGSQHSRCREPRLHFLTMGADHQPQSPCSAPRSGNMPSIGTMHSRFNRSAIAHKSDVSARWFLRFALLPVLSCASLHSFSSMLVFWLPVFQVLWINGRMFRGRCHDMGLLSGYERLVDKTFPMRIWDHILFAINTICLTLKGRGNTLLRGSYQNE